MRSILVVGAGPVARGLAEGLRRAGRAPRTWTRAEGGAVPEAEIVVLAVRDQAIGEVAARVLAGAAAAAPLPVFLHCAGGLGAEQAFAGLQGSLSGRGLLHPLRSFAGVIEQDARLVDVVFAVEGDPAGRAAARELAEALGGRVLELEGAALPRYHAAAVLASGHVVALVDAGVQLLRGLGLEPKAACAALASLLASTASNLERVGLPEALTGPIARGDAEVVAGHLQALVEEPEVLPLYRATAERVLQVAREQGRADPAALERIRALLSSG